MITPLQTHYDIVEKSPRLYKLHVSSESLLETLAHVTSISDFKTLSQLTCTDWIEEEIFALNYLLTTDKRDANLMLEIHIGRDDVTLPTLSNQFAQIEVMERELHEMFGIHFEGNETLYDFALEDWKEIPPMRREFDTLAYVNEHYDFRGGRDDNRDVKVEMKRRRAEAKALKEAKNES